MSGSRPQLTLTSATDAEYSEPRTATIWISHSNTWQRPDGRCDTQIEARQSWKKPLQPYGRYRQQYVYRCPGCLSVVEPHVLPAAFAIDWSVLGQRIGDRERPLKPKTLARIEAGIRRYARPIHLEAAGHVYDAADPKHPQHGNPDSYYRAWPADEPLRTMHTIESKALATPPLLVPAGGTWNEESTAVDEPMRTRTTRETEALVSPPLLVPTKGHAPLARDVAHEVMPTQTTHHALSLVVPPFIAELRGGGSKHRPVTAPLATVTASGNHHGLVQPPELAGIVMRNNNERGGNGHMSKPVSQPLRTLTTHGHQSLITWQAQYGYDSGILRSLGVPLPTQTTVSGDALLTGQHELPDVDECLFRMLEPIEIAAGMAFEHGYLVEGTKRQQVKGYGNAVTPCSSTLLLDRVVDAITGERAA